MTAGGDKQRSRSIFGEGLEDALVEHYLVDQVPVADLVGLQNLQHRRLVRPVVYRVVGTQVLVPAQGTLAPVLQHLYLVEQLVVALVVDLGDVLILGALLGDGFLDGVDLRIGLLLHAVGLVDGEPAAFPLVLLAPLDLQLFHHEVPLVVDKGILLVVDVVAEAECLEGGGGDVLALLAGLVVGLLVEGAFPLAVILSQELIILLLVPPGEEGLVAGGGLLVEVLEAGILFDALLFGVDDAEGDGLLPEGVEVDVVHVGLQGGPREQVVHVLLCSGLDEGLVEDVDDGRTVLGLLAQHRGDQVPQLLGVGGHDGGVGPLQDLHGKCVVVLGLEGEPEVAHFVEDDSEGPDVAAWVRAYLL